VSGGVRFELPPVGPPTAVSFPPIDRRTLASGLRMWSIRESAVPALTIVALLDGGSSRDPVGRAGLASLVTALMNEGAGGRDAIALSDALARIGGHIEVDTGPDATTLAVTTLSRHIGTAFQLLADIVRRPHFAEADFARARELRLNRLRLLSRTAGAVADRALAGAVFGDHPYAHGTLGTTRALEDVTLDELRDFWSAAWAPGRMTIIVSGDVAAEAAAAAAAAAFGDWPASGREWTPLPTPSAPADPSIRVVHRPGAPQSEVRVGQSGPPRRTPEYHAIVTLNALLGGQFTSRINRNLREAKAVTYGARTQFDMRRVGGVFEASTSVQGDASALAVGEILREMSGVMGDEAIGADELSHAKASLTRGYVRHFETAPQLARAAVQLATHDLPAETFDRFVPEVERLAAADVIRTARRILRPDTCAIVVVGDMDRHRASLEALGRPVTDTTVDF
jgi:zinc protease